MSEIAYRKSEMVVYFDWTEISAHQGRVSLEVRERAVVVLIA